MTPDPTLEFPWKRPALPLVAKLRRRVGSIVVDNFFIQGSRLSRLLPLSHPGLHKVTVERDIPYSDSKSRDHLLDVWRPKHAKGPLPVVLYIHGGGFRILSKDTHWLFGLVFARRGYVLFNINYRLSPHHAFPAALSDVAAAYQWVVKNAHLYGGDPSRLVVAGESAGANLATSVALQSVYKREEPFAKAVYETGVVPKAVFAACGMLQISDPERFLRRKKSWPAYVYDRLAEVTDAYFHRCEMKERGELDLADPLCFLERGEAPHRPLPAFFAPCGTRDPLLDDTRRLASALQKLGGTCRSRIYPGEVHAFHAFVFRQNARACWRDLFSFLDEHLRDGAGAQR